jgi:hypothetical protein
MAVQAHAGRPCAEPQGIKLETVQRALDLAGQTMNMLDQSGAKVVVIGRAGQDLSKYGLRYSHLGYAFAQPDGQGGQVWRVLHKLNQCGTAESAIYLQGLGEFFLDDLWRFEAAWIVPTEPVQAQLLPVLSDLAQATRMHHKPYSMVSYAWSTKYQQSNQWAIETLAMALASDGRSSAFGRTQAQDWLRAQDYQPTTLRIDAMTRFGARLTAANVYFDDHPNEKRYSDRIETVTVDSVFGWMQRAKLTSQSLVTLPSARQ